MRASAHTLSKGPVPFIDYRCPPSPRCAHDPLLMLAPRRGTALMIFLTWNIQQFIESRFSRGVKWELQRIDIQTFLVCITGRSKYFPRICIRRILRLSGGERIGFDSLGRFLFTTNARGHSSGHEAKRVNELMDARGVETRRGLTWAYETERALVRLARVSLRGPFSGFN